MVEPVHPLKGSVLDCFEVAPRPAPVDHLGLVEAVDRLGQSVVIAVADAADRGLDPGLGQALGVLDRYVLRPAVAMMDQATAMNRSAVMERLLERIQDEVSTGTEDSAKVGI
jgi:hypothetical protein